MTSFGSRSYYFEVQRILAMQRLDGIVLGGDRLRDLFHFWMTAAVDHIRRVRTHYRGISYLVTFFDFGFRHIQIATH